MKKQAPKTVEKTVEKPVKKQAQKLVPPKPVIIRERLDFDITLPVKPERIYNAWLDSDEHTAFTGSPALIDGKVKGKYTAWDGYIEGVTLELEPNKRIVQTWRTDDFLDENEDSKLEITFKKVKGGCTVTFKHTNIPKGQSRRYKEGWDEFYLKPMADYFYED